MKSKMGKKPSAACSRNEELHAAARSGDLTAVQVICGANPLAVNSRDRHSRTPYPFLFIFHFLAFTFFSLLFCLYEYATPFRLVFVSFPVLGA